MRKPRMSSVNPYDAVDLPPPKVRVYTVSDEGDFARAIITNDGSLSIISSFGNFGIWWNAIGERDVRAFVAGCDGSYLERSLLYKRADHKPSKNEVAGLVKKLWPKLKAAILADVEAHPDWE